jgi:hypothetical protein
MVDKHVLKFCAKPPGHEFASVRLNSAMTLFRIGVTTASLKMVAWRSLWRKEVRI